MKNWQKLSKIRKHNILPVFLVGGGLILFVTLLRLAAVSALNSRIEKLEKRTETIEKLVKDVGALTIYNYKEVQKINNGKVF